MDEFIRLVIKYESLRLHSYLCPAGVWTIGYGSTGPGIGPGIVWTKEQATQRLLKDTRIYWLAVRKLVPNAPETHVAALADFAYNLGLTRLKSSTLLKKYKQGDLAGARVEIKKWVHAGGKKLRGLELRRAEEASLLV